jgi:N-acyl-D-amino-acid deacylase
LHQETRSRLRAELRALAAVNTYWEGVAISSVTTEKNRWMEGETIARISAKLGTDEAETVLNILSEERLRVGAIFLSMCEDNLRKFLSLPYCAIGSDSSARCLDGPTRRGKPHPRTFGTFPRFFGKYVRDSKLMPLSMAVHKATMLPAAIFGLKERGQLKNGMYADITIFSPEEIIDRATFDEPFTIPDGIFYVLVNGIAAVWEGRTTGSRSGRMLSR